MEQVKMIMTLIVLLVAVNMNYAQTDDLVLTTESEKKGAFNESVDASEEVVEEVIPYYYRHHKKLSSFYSGYVIELTTSDLPLRRDYFLFEKFGNVLVDQLEEGGFSYVIQGFRNEKSAQAFLDNIVIHNAPEAKLVQYNKGERKIKS